MQKKQTTTQGVEPKVETPSKIEALLLEVIEGQKKIVEALNKPITSQVEAIKENIAVEQLFEVPKTSGLPVTPDIRDQVDSVLNKNFEVELEQHDDKQLLVFSVIVPDKYSHMTPSQREILKRDVRPKVVTRAGGLSEMKEWLETIYRNLTPEIQAMIASDRIKG